MMSSQYLLIQQVKQNCSRGYGGLLRPASEKLKLHFKLKLLEKKAFRTNKRKKTILMSNGFLTRSHIPPRANNEKNDLMAKSNEKVEEFFSRRSSSNAG